MCFKCFRCFVIAIKNTSQHNKTLDSLLLTTDFVSLHHWSLTKTGRVPILRISTMDYMPHKSSPKNTRGKKQQYILVHLLIKANKLKRQ